MDRLWWAVLRSGVGLAVRRRRHHVAERWLRAVAARRPSDVEARLLLAELELAAGRVGRAIAEAGIAIQLAPDDLRGMSLLLQADSQAPTQARGGDGSSTRAPGTAHYNLLHMRAGRAQRHRRSA